MTPGVLTLLQVPWATVFSQPSPPCLDDAGCEDEVCKCVTQWHFCLKCETFLYISTLLGSPVCSSGKSVCKHFAISGLRWLKRRLTACYKWLIHNHNPVCQACLRRVPETAIHLLCPCPERTVLGLLIRKEEGR